MAVIPSTVPSNLSGSPSDVSRNVTEFLSILSKINEAREISYYREVISRRDADVFWPFKSRLILHWGLDELSALLCDREDE
jgi:hypothetical protein